MLKSPILVAFIVLSLMFSVHGTSHENLQTKKPSVNITVSPNEEANEKSEKPGDKLSEFIPAAADLDNQIQTSTKVSLLAEYEKNHQDRFHIFRGDAENPEHVLRGGDTLDSKYQTDAENLKGKGTVSKIGYFPAQADVKDALTSKHKCSGTLVEDKHVLLSAHCVFNSVANELAVMAGDIFLLPSENPTRETRRVQLIVLHPDYVEGEGVGLEFNIAVLKLDMPFTRGNYLHPALIPNKGVANNTLCFLVGWGLGSVDGSEVINSYELYYSDVFTMDMEECYKCVGNAICAGKNQTKACIGDEAGPLMCNGVLHGIYIASANNCQSLSGIYTDVVFYKHWIDRIIEWKGNGPMPVPLPYARKRLPFP